MAYHSRMTFTSYCTNAPEFNDFQASLTHEIRGGLTIHICKGKLTGNAFWDIVKVKKGGSGTVLVLLTGTHNITQENLFLRSQSTVTNFAMVHGREEKNSQFSSQVMFVGAP